MADVVTEVTTRGPLAQLGRAITSVLVGIVMFFASFGVLWWNEGRQDVSEFVAEAVAIDANAPGMDQALAKSTGPISITQAAGDPQYLTGGNWLVLDRTAEMYAWVEDKQTTTKKQGTKEVTETTYTYTMKWTSDPKSSSSFHEPNGHENPTMSEMDLLSKATGVRVGSISVPFQEAQYRGSKPLTLSDDILLNSYYYEAAGNILYLRQGAGSNPSLGDVRFEYDYVPAEGEFTTVGAYGGGSMKPYIYDGSKNFLILAPGTAEALQAQLHGEHVMMTWILRIVGFVLMWAGLAGIFAPLTTVLSFIPLVGGMGRALVSMVMGLVALVLSVLTIILAKIWWLLMILMVIGIIALIVVGLVRRKKEPAEEPQPAA